MRRSAYLPAGGDRRSPCRLVENEAAPIVVGEPTLQQGFEKAVTRAAKTVKKDLNVATDQLASVLIESFRASESGKS